MNYAMFGDAFDDELVGLLIDAGIAAGVKSIVPGRFNYLLYTFANEHARYQADRCTQGHQLWDSRRRRLVEQFPNFGFEEVAAESWPEQTAPKEAAAEMYNSWRQSPGHWEYVNEVHDIYAYAMAQGRNGVWYACGIFGDRADP